MVRTFLTAVALALALVILWSLTHRYKGISGDAELYAVQAMSRIHLALNHDLFMQFGSQDRFTVFSPLYAWFISTLGLRTAALTLTLTFKVWLFAAAWVVVRTLCSSRLACMALSLIIIAAGTYGGYAVFRYAEDWVTARSFAESLAVTAIALYFRDFRIAAVVVALLAIFVHPIMALPGLLVVLGLGARLRGALAITSITVTAAIGCSLWAVHSPASDGMFAVMDPPWLEIVKERSIFLFPQTWSFDDWETNARPFLALAMTALVLDDSKVRRLSIAAMIVGAAGLTLALIAGSIGHIAIMIQAQTWRWMWLTCFLSILFVIPTVSITYRDSRCGLIVSLLLLAGWTFSPVDGAACMSLAMLVWVVRGRIDHRSRLYLRGAAFAFGIIIVAWMCLSAWDLGFAPTVESGGDSLILGRLRNILGLQVSAFILISIIVAITAGRRSRIFLTSYVALLGAGAAVALPLALRDVMRDGAPSEISEFAEWRSKIPPASNVFVAPAHNSATFSWFTLQRPSYLSVDQSAGVVFSRATAMEVKRRSQILLPMMAPSWRLLTAGSNAPDSAKSLQNGAKALTRERLIRVCRDQELGFVVAKENVGFDPVSHKHIGDWKDWNLYDCNVVRMDAPSS